MKYHTQKGSVLFFILIAVALFAALSYVVSGMMRGGGSTDVSDEEAKIYAGEIIDYAGSVRQTVQDLRISNNCSDTEISFENEFVSGYANGTDTACQIFDNDGGGMNWSSAASQFNDGTNWLFVASNVVDGVGSSDPDLILVLQNLNVSICTAINEKSGITDLGTDTAIDFTQFTGTYASTQTIDSADGNMMGCLYYVNSGNNPFFYQVLIAR